MASLGRHFNTSQGARYLNDDSSTNMEDDRQFWEPILAAENDNNFKKLKTVPIFSIHLLISCLISLTGIILALIWTGEKRCEAYFIMLYLRVIFGIITFIFDHIVKHHHENIRMNGYHEFYRETNVHKGVPLYVVTLWNTFVFFIQTLMHHYYGSEFVAHCMEIFLSPIVYITIFNSLESLIFIGLHGSYIRKVSTFNKNMPLPDALNGSLAHGGSLGITQRGANMAELLEKQADLINYLKDHNLRLNQKLMQLNSQVRTGNIAQIQ